jgi:hypothetical protein
MLGLKLGQTDANGFCLQTLMDKRSRLMIGIDIDANLLMHSKSGGYSGSPRWMQTGKEVKQVT